MEIKLAYFSFKTHLHVCDIKFDIWPVARGVLFSLRASVNALELMRSMKNEFLSLLYPLQR